MYGENHHLRLLDTHEGKAAEFSAASKKPSPITKSPRECTNTAPSSQGIRLWDSAVLESA